MTEYIKREDVMNIISQRVNNPTIVSWINGIISTVPAANIEPTMSVSKIVNLMKSYTTYHIWKRYPNYLRKHFWKEHTFWTDGYFACSVGNVSEEMLKKYIENQG